MKNKIDLDIGFKKFDIKEKSLKAKINLLITLNCINLSLDIIKILYYKKLV